MQSNISNTLHKLSLWEHKSLLSSFSSEMPHWAIQIPRGKVCPCYVCMCVYGDVMQIYNSYSDKLHSTFQWGKKMETQQPTKTYLARTTILDIWNFLHLLKNILYPCFSLSYCLNQCPVLYSGGPCVTSTAVTPMKPDLCRRKNKSQRITLLPHLEHFLLFPTCWTERGARGEGINILI